MSETLRKTAKKPKPPQKTAKLANKKPHKKAKKRKNTIFAEALPAVLLAAILIAVSVCISIVIITLNSAAGREKQEMAGTIQSQSMPEAAKPETLAVENPPQAPPALARPAPEPPPSATPASPAAKPAPPPAKSAPVKPPAPAAPAGKKTATAVPREPAAPQNPGGQTPARKPSPVAAAPSRPAAPPERPPKPIHKGTIVFVIDDAGNNLRELEPFLRFPGPLTIAVLPGLPHSAEAARRIRAAGKEVFLHQPMEALGGQPPGPEAIYSGMSAAEIRSVLGRNVAEIGPIAGINNHQGSKITMDQAAMETILAFCREQGICFLDSRTTAESAAPAAAKRLGIKIGERNVFIDNEQNRDSMLRYIKEGLEKAERQGSAVMIGHTWSPELAPILTELYSGLVEQGYGFSTASRRIRNEK